MSVPLLRFAHRLSSLQPSRYMGCTIPDPQISRTMSKLTAHQIQQFKHTVS